jgi:hypothetical protein
MSIMGPEDVYFKYVAKFGQVWLILLQACLINIFLAPKWQKNIRDIVAQAITSAEHFLISKRMS